MAKNAYPSSADLEALLTSYGLTLDPEQVDSAVLAGIASFEAAVDRVMLAPTEPATRTYEPPSDTFGVLDLCADLATQPTVIYQPHGGTPETFVLGRDYRLDPENAPQDRRPWERLRFQRRWYAPYSWEFGSSLSITGRWGYGGSLPEDVWRAMLMGGLTWLIGQALGGTTGGLGGSTAPLKAWKEADTSEEYAVPSWSDRRAALQADIDGIVKRYRKVYL